MDAASFSRPNGPGAARILVVDDEPSVREILRHALEGEGYGVQLAENGSVMLEMIKEHEFDLVLTDLIMPEMDGIQAMLELRALNPAVPIIAMSGGVSSGGGDFLPLARQLGAKAVIAKPFTYNALMNVIRETVGTAVPA